jgi:hypothetical protein
MVFESVARLNATEPSKVGQTDSWSNPETKSSGSSTILRVFHSGGMPCHLVRHQIVASGSRLSPHLVPHAEPGMEDQGLIRRAERCPDIAGGSTDGLGFRSGERAGAPPAPRATLVEIVGCRRPLQANSGPFSWRCRVARRPIRENATRLERKPAAPGDLLKINLLSDYR